jgi:hypothetical protein
MRSIYRAMIYMSIRNGGGRVRNFDTRSRARCAAARSAPGRARWRFRYPTDDRSAHRRRARRPAQASGQAECPARKQLPAGRSVMARAVPAQARSGTRLTRASAPQARAATALAPVAGRARAPPVSPTPVAVNHSSPPHHPALGAIRDPFAGERRTPPFPAACQPRRHPRSDHPCQAAIPEARRRRPGAAGTRPARGGDDEQRGQWRGGCGIAARDRFE